MAETSTATRLRTWAWSLGTCAALVVGAAVQLPVANAADEIRTAPAAPAASVTAPLSALTPGGDPSLTTPLRAADASRRAAARQTAATVRAAGAVRPVVVRASAAPQRAAGPVASATAAGAAPVRASRTRGPAAAADLCSGPGWQARRGNAALASLRAGASRTGFSVTFAPARSGYLGLTHLQSRRIEVFVRSCGQQSSELLRHVMAHELGHAWDTARMTAMRRAEWQRVRGIPAGTPWYGCSGCTDFATPAGDFAEVYAQWARGSVTNRSRLAGDPSPAQLRGLAERFFGA